MTSFELVLLFLQLNEVVGIGTRPLDPFKAEH
jgi:hypothetical protein